MARKYAVRYLPAAERDLLSIHDWIADDNPERAATFVEELDRAITKLACDPHMGVVPRLPKLRGTGYRVLHGSRRLEEII